MPSRTDPDHAATVASTCRSNAVHVVRLAWSTHPQIGFDRAGVAWLDDYIGFSAPLLEGDLADEFVAIMGCFYGECLIEEFGGRWDWSGDLLGVRTDGLGFTYPFSAVARRLRLGEEGSLTVAFLTAREYLRSAA